jgi:hypothetical protein
MPRSVALAILCATTVLWVALGLAAIIPALFSVMMFDAPGSEKNLAVRALAASLMGFPIVCGFSVAKSWLVFREKAYWLACALALLPLINVAVGGAGLAWIQLVQGGKFNG